MWAIIKKEVRTYFLSPIGYVFVGLFLLMASLFFYSEVLVTGSTMFSNIFYSLSTILIMIVPLLTMIVPLLTMRTFSEERKDGTEQLLLTAPRSVTSIVLGKFFAALIVLLIAVVLTFIYYIILMFLGNPNIKTSLVTVFGFILLGAALISFGMFASSITENQVIAAIVSIAFYVITWIGTPYLSQSLEPLGLMNMFNRFGNGQIACTEVVAFISYTVLFVLLTIIVIQRRKSVK